MQEYKNDELTVRYDPKVCIHAGECVRGLPSVSFPKIPSGLGFAS